MNNSHACRQLEYIREEGELKPDLKGRLILRGVWGQHFDFRNLLLRSANPSHSTAPKKVKAFYVFSSSPYLFIYFSKPCC